MLNDAKSHFSVNASRLNSPLDNTPAISKFSAPVKTEATSQKNATNLHEIWKEKLNDGCKNEDKKENTLLQGGDEFIKKGSETFLTVKSKIANLLQYKLVVLLLVFILTGVLLMAINPPMVQEESDGKSKRSPKKIFVWSALSALLAFLIPVGVSHFKPPIVADV